MTITVTTPPVPRLAPEWQDWLASNVVRGCSDADMMRTMRDNGFDEQYARVAISVVRSMTERVQQNSPSLLTDYKADRIRLPASPRIRAGDREVQVGFTMSDPNVALLIDVLSEDECSKLIQLSAGKLKRSEVVDRKTGGTEVSNVRTSEGTHFDRGENAVIQRLEQRVAALTGVPVENGEPVQILHYRVGGEYKPHHDYFEPADPGSANFLKTGGQRIATFVFYLNDVDSGGDTVFPELEMGVAARRGSAVYFEYHNVEGKIDPRCLHGGAPVVRGEKWIATKWLRIGPYVSA